MDVKMNEVRVRHVAGNLPAARHAGQDGVANIQRRTRQAARLPGSCKNVGDSYFAKKLLMTSATRLIWASVISG
jgi:hypothetical protein